jgi:hypothetical protein
VTLSSGAEVAVVTPPGRLVVHTADGVIEVPLTGDPHHDALLARLARLGGTVTDSAGALVVPDPDAEARRAMAAGD